jgi:hypothetical protein
VRRETFAPVVDLEADAGLRRGIGVADFRPRIDCVEIIENRRRSAGASAIPE